MPEDVPEELLQRIRSVTNKRARVVLDRILQNGSISTEELSVLGYNHPPRAARDVRELGIRLKTIKVKHSDGRSIAAYVFDLEASPGVKSGRVDLPKQERDALFRDAGGQCKICGATTNLQIDHRVPYEIGGEPLSASEGAYQVLDGTCNRKKSWACEHCRNWIEIKDAEICGSCYWANPDSYKHVAMTEERRADIVWRGSETRRFDEIRERAEREGRTVPEQMKRMLRIRRKP